MKDYPGKLPTAPKRPSKWIIDKELYKKGIAPSDTSYIFSKAFKEKNPDSPQLGYDRGHMAMKQHAWRLGANADWNINTVLNACPQKHELNDGIWGHLEEKTAAWSNKYRAVWIIAGTVFSKKSSPQRWLGEPGEVPVAIQEKFFKIVVREEAGEIHVLAFTFNQADGYGSNLKPHL